MRTTIVVALLISLGGSAWIMRDTPVMRQFILKTSDYSEMLHDKLDSLSESTVNRENWRPPGKKADSSRLKEQASEYVEELTTTKTDPLLVDKADHFVSRDQVITLAASNTVMRLEEPVTADSSVATIGLLPPRDAISSRETHKAGVAHLTLLESTGEYLSGRENKSTALSITLADILKGASGDDPDSIYYVRTVKKTDYRGIWGIVVDGLTENFAKGIAIRRNEELGTYRVDIPEKADHTLADKTSSFLGRMIDRKTRDSHVFNFIENKMGRNPDLIFPGQELVIVDFEPRELVAIYRYFVEGEQ